MERFLFLTPRTGWGKPEEEKSRMPKACSLSCMLSLQPLAVLLPSFLSVPLLRALGWVAVASVGSRLLPGLFSAAAGRLGTAEVASGFINNAAGLIVACRLSCWLESYDVVPVHRKLNFNILVSYNHGWWHIWVFLHLLVVLSPWDALGKEVQ